MTPRLPTVRRGPCGRPGGCTPCSSSGGSKLIDERDVVEVEPAGGDVGRDQRRDLPALEPLERPLRAAPGSGRRASPSASTPCCSSLRASRSAPRLVRTKTSASPRSASSSSTSVSSFVSSVTGTNRCSISPGACSVRELGLDADGRLRVRAGELADLAVERRGEEHRLAVAREALDDPVDLRLEAHVEHPVGLVEDEDLDRVERDMRRSSRSWSRPGVATMTCASRARFACARSGDAAVDATRPRGRAGVASDLDLLGDLERELARRDEDERRRARARRAATRSTSGSAKASVLPEPVGDFASRSVPRAPAG